MGELIELTFTKREKSTFYVDKSIGVYNREIEKLQDDETEFDKIKLQSIEDRTHSHLNKLRKNK